MSIETGQKWYAKRQAVAARTDEDAAMAYKSEGPFATQGEAVAALIKMIECEIAGWKRVDTPAERDERALARVKSGETDVTEDGLHWHVIEVTGNPSAMVTKWQCDVHAVTINHVSCCEHGTELGAYLLDERVCCAYCEEPIVEPGNDEGRRFGQRTSNGPTCMPCTVELQFAGERLSVTQAALLAWFVNPTKANATRCKRATALTYIKLEHLGFIVRTDRAPFHLVTIMGREFVKLRVRETPTIPAERYAANLVEMALSNGRGGVVVEESLAHELADAIERHDSLGTAYNRAALDALAQIKRLVVAAGGEWK